MKIIFGDEAEVRKNPDACAITLSFMEFSSQVLKERFGGDYYVSVDPRGRCKTFCERAGGMSGRYIKRD